MKNVADHSVRYLKLLAQLETDTEYLAMKESFQEAQRALQVVIPGLEPAKQEIIYEYLGILAEMQMRELELAFMLK